MRQSLRCIISMSSQSISLLGAIIAANLISVIVPLHQSTCASFYLMKCSMKLTTHGISYHSDAHSNNSGTCLYSAGVQYWCYLMLAFTCKNTLYHYTDTHIQIALTQIVIITEGRLKSMWPKEKVTLKWCSILVLFVVVLFWVFENCKSEKRGNISLHAVICYLHYDQRGPCGCGGNISGGCTFVQRCEEVGCLVAFVLTVISLLWITLGRFKNQLNIEMIFMLWTKPQQMRLTVIQFNEKLPA